MSRFFSAFAATPAVVVQFHCTTTTPSIFLDKTKEHMLGSDKFTVQSLGFLVGKLHDLDCSIGKTRMKGAYR